MLDKAKTAIKWLLGLVVALVVAALFDDPLSTRFKRSGYHDDPSKIGGDVMNWMESIIGEQAFAWVAAIVLTSAFFIYVVPLFQKKEAGRKLRMVITDFEWGGRPLANYQEEQEFTSTIALDLNIWALGGELCVVEWRAEIFFGFDNYKCEHILPPEFYIGDLLNEEPPWIALNTAITPTPQYGKLEFYTHAPFPEESEKAFKVYLQAVDTFGKKHTISKKFFTKEPPEIAMIA